MYVLHYIFYVFYICVCVCVLITFKSLHVENN